MRQWPSKSNRTTFSLMLDIAQGELSRIWIPGTSNWIKERHPLLAEAIVLQEKILDELARATTAKHDEFNDVWDEICIWRDLQLIGIRAYRTATSADDVHTAA